MPQAAPLDPQANFYTQAPGENYGIFSHPLQGHFSPRMNDGAMVGSFGDQLIAVLPRYSQTNQQPVVHVLRTVPLEVQPERPQICGPLFDASDRAFFNPDVTNLIFTNQYGTVELNMLGHISPGVAGAQERQNGLLNLLNQAANELALVVNPNPTLGRNGLPDPEWQSAHCQNGSIQMQDPITTPITAIDNLNKTIQSEKRSSLSWTSAEQSISESVRLRLITEPHIISDPEQLALQPDIESSAPKTEPLLT